MLDSWFLKRKSNEISRFAWRQRTVSVAPNATRLEMAASLATILASFVAALALSFGYYQFQATQLLTRQTLELQKDALQHEREAKAIDLFLKFNEVQTGISTPARGKTADVLFWQQNMAMTITEAVFKLMQSDPGWMATVKFMLREQEKFLKQDGLECETFLKDFIDLAREVVKQDICR